MKQGVLQRLDRENRWLPLIQNGVPWLLFLALLAWGWRTTDLAGTVPSYGDVLEGLWAIDWYDLALRTGVGTSVYPLAFHPEGWQVATYAWGPLNLAFLMPLARLGGAALAYNVITLLTFFIAFAGAKRLSSSLMGTLGAAVAALLYTFWGFRWYSIIGQLNVGVASALLPWMLWTFDRGFTQKTRSTGWFVLTGVLWAFTVNSSLYFVWIGGIALLAWGLGRWKLAATRGRSLLLRLFLVPLTAGVLSLPVVLWFMRAAAASSASFFTLFEVSLLGVSVNSLPIPYLQHPHLGPLSAAIYHGPIDSEAGLANFGLLACVMAVIGAAIALRSKAWRPVLILAGVSLFLALGLVLRWDNQTVQWGMLRPLNALIWRVGYALKPGLFLNSQVAYPFADAVPMPGLLLSAVVPFFERARVFARYALPAGLAIFLLAGLAITRVRRGWLRYGLAGLLLFEVLPPPTQSYAFPPASHPAFGWLRQQAAEPEGIVELDGQPGLRMSMPMGGDTLWATRLHRQATTGGASSIWPAHTIYLIKWLAEHPRPFKDPDFVSLLRYYGVRYVLLYMHGESVAAQLDDAKQNDGLRLAQCFSSDHPAPPYDSPICVLELQPPAAPDFNLLLRGGWSGPESWGRWVDGTTARALFVATRRAPIHLSVQAFPFCVPDRSQKVTLSVNHVPLTTHEWGDCEPWSSEIEIPASLITIGENELILDLGYGARPIDITAGENKDSRSLSVGVTQLHLGFDR